VSRGKSRVLKRLWAGASPLGAPAAPTSQCLRTQDPATDLSPSQHTRKGKDNIPGWEEEERAAERGITQTTLSYRSTPRAAPCRRQRCRPAWHRAPTRKNPQSLLCTQNEGKGDKMPVPKRILRGTRRCPSACRSPGSRGCPGAGVTPPARSCLPEQPRVKGRPDAAVMGVTLIDTCHLMGSVNASPCSHRTRASIPSRQRPWCHRKTGCHLGEGGGTPNTRGAGESTRARPGFYKQL